MVTPCSKPWTVAVTCAILFLDGQVGGSMLNGREGGVVFACFFDFSCVLLCVSFFCLFCGVRFFFFLSFVLFPSLSCLLFMVRTLWYMLVASTNLTQKYLGVMMAASFCLLNLSQESHGLYDLFSSTQRHRVILPRVGTSWQRWHAELLSCLLLQCRLHRQQVMLFTLWRPSTAGWEDSCARSSRIDT